RFDLESAYELKQIFTMCSNITNAASNTRFSRISTPRSLFTACSFQWFHEPVLNIFDQHFANLSDLSLTHECACMAYRWVAGVVVRERKDEIIALDEGNQFLCLFEVKGHGFVADYMDAMLQERFYDGEMDVVGRCHHHKIDAVL